MTQNLVAAIDTVRAFTTPEHISFRYRTAGPLVRSWAWIIDLIVRAAVLFVMAIPALLLGFKVGNQLGIGIWLVAYFLADWLFGAVCEWRWRGLTPGKKMCGIRVIGDDAQAPSLGACLLRNVLRFADVLPTPATGVVTMVFSGSFQRLGDLAAGTLVVYDQRATPARVIPSLEPAAQRLLGILPPSQVAALDGETSRMIAAFVAARSRFHPTRRQEMAAPLVDVLRARWDIPSSPASDPDAFLCAVHRLLFGKNNDADHQAPAQAQIQGQAQGMSGAAARATAYLGRRRTAWSRLEGWLAGDGSLANATRPRGASPAELSALYRGACADLALANAYHLPAATGEYLHHLVARAHARFYRRAAWSWQALFDVVLITVPGRLYGDPCLRVALAAFFGVFLVSGLLSAWHPELAATALGNDHLDDLREMYAHGFERDGGEGAMMYGFYIKNNVGIAMACFASGIFAGVGSLLWLAFNGIALGCSFGYMTTVDAATSGNFFTFVLAHGPFELTGITLAGAAGLRLGLGLVVTKGLPWRASLRRAASEAVPILSVAAVLVACAAPIEAFVSPSRLPVWAKAGVGIVCSLVLVVYLVGLGRHGRRVLISRRESHS